MKKICVASAERKVAWGRFQAMDRRFPYASAEWWAEHLGVSTRQVVRWRVGANYPNKTTTERIGRLCVFLEKGDARVISTMCGELCKLDKRARSSLRRVQPRGKRNLYGRYLEGRLVYFPTAAHVRLYKVMAVLARNPNTNVNIPAEELPPVLTCFKCGLSSGICCWFERVNNWVEQRVLDTFVLMTNDEHLREAAIELGLGLYENYSGRAMYGKTCLAVRFNNEEQFQELVGDFRSRVFSPPVLLRDQLGKKWLVYLGSAGSNEALARQGQR